MVEIHDFKADDQDTHEEKTKQNEKATKVNNQEMLNVDRSEVDADFKSLNEETFWSGYWLGRTEESGRLSKLQRGWGC